MDLIVVGPGRAGQALSLRLLESGHRVIGVLARDDRAARDAAERLGGTALAWDRALPPADLLVLAVTDDAIAAVAARLAPHVGSVEAVIHLSGLTPVAALGAFDDLMIGSFHPLQTLPTPEAGAARLEGAWVGITAREDLLADRLFALAASAGMRGFELDDDVRAVYHAAAAAAANFPVTALAMAHRLFEAASVPFEASAPLVEAIVANSFEMGPAAALTGPIARGDVGTVAAQLEAVEGVDPALAADFRALARATARLAGTADLMAMTLE